MPLLPIVRQIVAHGRVHALVVHARARPEATAFVSDPADAFQLGVCVYTAGHEVPRHTHRPVERAITSTSEALVVRSGRCELSVYDDAEALVATVTLEAGDAAVLLCGGHGFRMLEDTVLIDIKQGPYAGPDEKRLF